MSKIYDPFPNYSSAGLKKDTGAESASECLQPPLKAPPTPEDILKYRKSFKERSGVTIPHYGTVFDPLPPSTHAYGLPTEKSEKAGEVLVSGHKPGVIGFINEIKQSNYGSSIREPLGQSINRSYNLPDAITTNAQFSYGKPTDQNQFSAKQTLCPNEYLDEIDKVKKMYLKSHGSFEPGQQKNREFNWNVDPTDFRFGKVEKNPVDREIYKVMHPESQPDSFNPTKFVKTNYNDFVNLKEDKLGKPRNLGQNKDLPPDFVFGVRHEPNEWDAGKCLTGEATFKDVETDADIGRATKPGFRNTPKPGDEARVFGVPSIRTDIQKPKNASVADPNNYGEECRAVELLFPSSYSELGISAEDFEVLRDKIEIKEIFQKIGFVYKRGKFEAIFARAKEFDNTILDKVSCKSFLRAVKELDQIQ